MSAIPVNLRELVANGNFIAMIPRGVKPNMHTKSFVDATSFIGAFYRYIHGENRREMVMSIDDLVEQFSILLDNYKNTDYMTMLLKTLKRMKDGGISNLYQTYQELNAPDIVAKLQVTMDTIDIILRKYNFEGCD